MKLKDNVREKLEEDLFVSNKEEMRGILGNSYLENIVSNSGTSEGVVILTNKRLYVKGKSYRMRGKSLEETYQESAMDLEDITSAGHREVYNPKFAVLCFVSLLLGVICSVLGGYWLTSLFLIQTITFAAIYLVKGGKMIEINFMGGSILLKSIWYSTEEMNNFNKDLLRAKEVLKEEYKSQVNAVQSNNKETMSPNSKIEEIKELQTMLDGGVIDEKEFNQLKVQIIGK